METNEHLVIHLETQNISSAILLWKMIATHLNQKPLRMGDLWIQEFTVGENLF